MDPSLQEGSLPSAAAFSNDVGDSGNLIPVIERQVKRTAVKNDAAYRDSAINENAASRGEKQVVISKLRSQNEKLKTELKMLTGKLEQFIEKSRQRKHKQMFGVAGHELSQKDE